MRICLGNPCRNPQDSGSQHHRAPHVAAPSEDDVGLPPTEDADALGRRGDGTADRPQEPQAQLAGKSLDPERIEPEPGPGGEAGLDGFRTPGERD